jgi:hypothetical protein
VRDVNKAVENAVGHGRIPLMEIRAQAERGSGVGLELFGFISESVFGFISESVFTFIPESCSGSSRKSVHVLPDSPLKHRRSV